MGEHSQRQSRAEPAASWNPGLSFKATRTQQTLQSDGQPMSSTTQGAAGSRFGHDFSQVRAHTKVAEPFDLLVFQGMIKEWALMDKAKSPIVSMLAKGYVNRPGKLQTRDRVIHDTPYGGTKVIPGIREPSEAEVYWAIYGALDLKKTGKGYSATDWTWRDAPAREKTREEKLKEVGTFVAEEYVTDKIEDKAVKVTAQWLTGRSLVALATVLTGAAQVYGIASLVIGVYDLLMSLQAPAELSPAEQKKADIVAGVKDWLQREQRAADLRESLTKPFKVAPYIAVPDKTAVRRSR